MISKSRFIPAPSCSARSLRRWPVWSCRAFASASSAAAAQPELKSDESSVTLSWPDTTTRFHHLFLRDHCLCKACTHETTRQRLLDTSSIPFDVKPQTSQASAEGLSLSWPDGHTSLFPWSWLQNNSYNSNGQASSAAVPTDPTKRPWTVSDIQREEPAVEYQDVMNSNKGLCSWLKQVEERGFCFVNNAPATAEATEKLAERIAFIRETHYGKFWDFTSDLSHADTAYTSIALGLHTDTTYFSDPVGLQMFHLLSDRSTHTGGHSLLSDGLQAANQLKTQHPVFYELLNTLPVPAHASGGDDARFSPMVQRPILEHDTFGKLVCIRYNNDDRAPVGRGPAWEGTVDLSSEGLGSAVDKVPAFYYALRKWSEMINSPQLSWEFPMQPGRPFIFDNKRILHGRTSFAGQRRLCGAYINGDDFHSRLRLLQEQVSSEA